MYYIWFGNREVGPFTLEELWELAQQKQISADTPLRSGEQWGTALDALGAEAFGQATQKKETSTGQAFPSPSAPVFKEPELYYLSFGDKEAGPFTYEELQDLVKQGRLAKNTLARIGIKKRR